MVDVSWKDLVSVWSEMILIDIQSVAPIRQSNPHSVQSDTARSYPCTLGQWRPFVAPHYKNCSDARLYNSLFECNWPRHMLICQAFMILVSAIWINQYLLCKEPQRKVVIILLLCNATEKWGFQLYHKLSIGEVTLNCGFIFSSSRIAISTSTEYHSHP